MTDLVHATPTTQSSIAPMADTNEPTVTTNFQPAPNKPLSGGRAAIAVVIVFIFAGTMMYYRYQQRIDAFFSGGSQERPVVVQARPPAKPSKLDASMGRPTQEAPLPTIVRSNQPPQLYFGQ